MPDNPVPGDGVIDIPIPEEGNTDMGLDLPPGVGQVMMTETAANIQTSNNRVRGVFDAVMGALAGTVQQNFKDIGAIEGRTVSGVMATPLASPTMKV